MARYKFEAVVQAVNGDVISGADVSVYLDGTNAPAKIYLAKDATDYVNNPPQLTSDISGRVVFWVDDRDYTREQRFRIEVVKDAWSYIVDDVDVIEEDRDVNLSLFFLQKPVLNGWYCEFSYDTSGNLIGINVKNSGGDVVAICTVNYDIEGNLSSEVWGFDNKSYNYVYSYDANGNLVRINVTVS